MKASMYNFFFPYDDTYCIAFNSISNALALLEKRNHEKLLAFCEKNVELKDPKLIEDLKVGGFLIEDDANELELLRHRMQRQRFDTSTLSLTIAPTSDCNFRCLYCYEKDVIKPIYISPDVEANIIEFVKNQSSSINNLSITWYGGEPLMAIEAIKRMSEEFISICKEKDIHYHASMVTNGYLLSVENCEILKECKIGSIQVTLDGDAKIHNIRRPLKNGHPTFKKIIDNLVNGFELLPYVSLRVNIDKSNINSGENIYDYIKELGLESKVHPYLGRVSSDNECIDEAVCLPMEDFFKEDFNYAKKNTNDHSFYRYPQPIGNACGADKFNSYIINADGELYKCWSDIGNKTKSIGSILETRNLNSVYFEYMMYDATQDPNCKDCKLLPNCMGGCPFRRINDPNIRCSIYKYMLEEYLEYYTKLFKDRQRQNELQAK